MRPGAGADAGNSDRRTLKGLDVPVLSSGGDADVRCILCGSRLGIIHLNTEGEQGRSLCDALEIKREDAFAICVCKECLASHTLTGDWPLMCSVCKKGFAKAPMPCDSCGGLTCSDCATSQIPPGRWEIKFNMPMERVEKFDGKVRLCKNCVAEKVLTEEA